MSSFLIDFSPSNFPTYFVYVLFWVSVALVILAFKKPYFKFISKFAMSGEDFELIAKIKKDRIIFRKAVVFAIVAAIASAIGKMPFWFCLAAFVFSLFLLPKYFKWKQHKNTLEAFDKALVESLTSVCNSLRAGLTLNKALEVSLQNTPRAFASQADICLKEYRLGLPIDDALDNIRIRRPTQSSNIAFGALIIGRKLGGPLPVILGRIADTIRERDRVEGRLKALTAQGRAQGVILCSLPVLFAIGTAIFSPDKFDVMTQTLLGQVLLTIAILLEVIGIVVTIRILQLDI